MEKLGNITLYNADCMEIMKGFSDKQFDLALVDPPYGIDFGTYNRTNKTATGERVKANKYHCGDWDKNTPTKSYFTELQRISKNQIIWGGNYFNLPPSKCFIFWYKHQPVNNFSDGEFAWTSFNKPAKCFDYPYYGNINSEQDRIHPTQKPIKLYEWILKNFASDNDSIIDTHLGSASSAIACHRAHLDFTGIELDEEYYNAAKERIIMHQRQLNLF